MTTVFNFDFSNPTHAQIFSQVVALTSSANIPMQVIGTATQEVSQPSSTPVEVRTDKESKTPYVATKDFKAQYEIKEQTSTDGTKLFCISRKNGWTKAEKKLMNDSIKSLKNIKEIEVEADFKKKDGTTYKGTFKAWGYNTLDTAKKHMRELPAVFTAEQLNGAV